MRREDSLDQISLERSLKPLHNSVCEYSRRRQFGNRDLLKGTSIRVIKWTVTRHEEVELTKGQNYSLNFQKNSPEGME